MGPLSHRLTAKPGVILCRCYRVPLNGSPGDANCLLKADCVVVLVEGRWHTGGGLTAEDADRIVRTVRTSAEVQHLTDSVYWGKEITDERYLLVSGA